MGFFSNICACIEKRLKRRSGETDVDDDNGGGTSSDLFFQLQTLQAATNFFSEINLLGHGGFGPVYKGLIPNGQEVAVKKLSLSSRQGIREFTNEVKLLLKLQHRNLVTMLGCCVEGPEMMLIYEYLQNKSLDYFLFGARGLLYLHEEAPERIIHRDIKASNILLDDRLHPKISDFGLARLFPGDDTHVNTFKIAGTYGYMAPEYALHGFLSVKTDVFSFGILVLEIVSGRKNHDGHLGAEKADVLNYAWKLFQEGKTMELVDKALQKYDSDEAAMCIQLGLLCCQSSVADRPDMNSINLMLCSESFKLPKPGKPAIQGRAGRWSITTTTTGFTDNTNATSTQTAAKTSASSSFVEEYSRNSISYSSLDEGR